MSETTQVDTSANPQGNPEDLPVDARRHPAVAAIRHALVRRCGFSPQADPGARTIVLGISGGADSLALLVAVLAIGTNRGFEEIRPIAVHVNHHLRPDADRDAAHVRRICKRFGVPCIVRDVHPAGDRENVSAEARRLRYAALADAAREHEARFIAAAHHAPDQLETLLMHLCRGTGIAGLCGMPWRRTLAEHQDDGEAGAGPYLIRPLLAQSREDCESLCRAADIEWIEDPFNRDRSRARARLRADVLPVLESLWPGASQRAAGTADLLDAWRAWIEAYEAALLQEHLADRGPERIILNRDTLRDLAEPLVAAVLRRAALALAEETAIVELDREQIGAAAGAVRDDEVRPRTYEWPGDIRIHIRSSEAIVERT